MHANVERLRAERLLDAAQAAAYPHLEPRSRSSFLSENQRRRARALPPGTRVGETVPTGSNALFTVDGKPVDKHGLIRWLGATFGAGGPFRGQPAANGHDTGNGRGPVVRDNGHANGHANGRAH